MCKKKKTVCAGHGKRDPHSKSLILDYTVPRVKFHSRLVQQGLSENIALEDEDIGVMQPVYLHAYHFIYISFFCNPVK